MDDNYQTYLNRIVRMTLPQAYQNQVQHIQESTKFHHSPSQGSQAAPFPGYTIITPPQGDDSINSLLYTQLHKLQCQLVELLSDANLIVPLPLASFHLTLADLIWDSAYKNACSLNPNYEVELRDCIQSIFQQYQNKYPHLQTPIIWRYSGLIVMPRAIGVALVPRNASDYEQIINFRRLVYQNPQLVGLGIEQHYHFTAHITLGYFRTIPANFNRDRFVDLLDQLNQTWLDQTLEFTIHRAELRKFDDMSHFYRQPDWATLDFGTE